MPPDNVVHMFEDESGPDDSAHPLQVVLDTVRRAAQDVQDVPAWGLSTAELARLVRLHEAVTAQLAAMGLGLVREADRRDLGAGAGAVSTADWLRDRLCLDHGTAKSRVELAMALDVPMDLLAVAGEVHATAWRDGMARPYDTGYPDPAAPADSDVPGGRVDPVSVPHMGSDGRSPGARGRTGLGVDAVAVSELAVAARQSLPCTAWALRAGRIGVEHARVILRALKRLPSDLDALAWAECEAFLAVHATGHGPRNLARLASHLVTSVTGAHELARQHSRETTPSSSGTGAGTHAGPDQRDGNACSGETDHGHSTCGEHSSADADGHEPSGTESSSAEPSSSGCACGGGQVGAVSGVGAGGEAAGGALDNDRAEERAEASAMFGFIDDGDGTVRVYGRLSAEAADLITSALAPLAAPRPAADGTPDPRGHGRRMAEALTELCRRAMDTATILPGARGARPHVSITASLATLRGEPGCPKAVSMWGTPITPQAARRIACDAAISRVLTDPAGVPLDVGRAYRSVTPGQWTALVARDKGCAFPGCSRPAAWTQAHHIIHWVDGGPTDLSNLVLLCAHHHRSVHHRGWTVRLGADKLPEFIPPPWIDPRQHPRRNTYHRIPDALTHPQPRRHAKAA